MTFDQTVIASVTALVGMIFLAMGLRNLGMLREKDGDLFARLITQYTMPALIFSSLSTSSIDLRKLLLAVVMIVSQLACALLAWGVSCLLRLSRSRKGALVLGSTFTSSGFLGYALVKQVYTGNQEALADAAIVSELGVGAMIFTVGILIAIYFGSPDISAKAKRQESLKFFRSPIFIALTLGILVSFIPLPRNNWVMNAFYRVLQIASNANTLLVTLTIGVMLHFKDFRSVWPIVVLACIIKLFIQPLVAFGQSELLNFPPVWHQIVVLEASMPTAALSAVFAKRYGCDAELTGILVFTTFVSSILTIVTMTWLLG
jgi:hypothetical protein